MWTALLAFAGGVVAVGLKGCADYLLERRREKRALQVAARFVFEELWNASAGIESDLFMQEVPRPDTFTWDAWDANRDLLAPAIDFEHWRLVLSGYTSLRAARDVCEEEIERQSGSRDLTNPKVISDLTDLQHSIGIARSIVAELIKGHEWDPFPAHDDAYKKFEEKRHERRRRRARLVGKLRARVRMWRERSSHRPSKG